MGGVAGGLAKAAVVIAQGGDAVAGEVVGDDGKGLVVEECLIAVLQAAARDEKKAEGSPTPDLPSRERSCWEGEGGGKGMGGGG